MPANSRKTTGFTLIELLIGIAILAVLSAIGIVIYSNAQRTSRDARRRADVLAIAKALEVGRGNANSETYPALTSSMFTSGGVPGDPGSRIYCVTYTTTSAGTLTADPAAWTTNTCPGPAGAANWNSAGNSYPPSGAYKYRVCASLENTGTSTLFCATSQQ